VLGGLSLLPQVIEYSNLNAKMSCLYNSGQWEREEKQIGGMQPYANDTITLIFYSDVDVSLISHFYFDAVKIKVCTAN